MEVEEEYVEKGPRTVLSATHSRDPERKKGSVNWETANAVL